MLRKMKSSFDTRSRLYLKDDRKLKLMAENTYNRVGICEIAIIWPRVLIKNDKNQFKYLIGRQGARCRSILKWHNCMEINTRINIWNYRREPSLVGQLVSMWLNIFKKFSFLIIHCAILCWGRFISSYVVLF